ncbi:hypothetical protein KAJ77_04605, partial [bacterium]|nr:hypothetical protein [bacterium]
MAGISGKQGKDLLIAILNELKSIDPRIVPLDSDEIQALEDGVIQGVRDVFGSESPEYSEFEEFRIPAGHISRGDSRAEKQSKYELGLPKAAQRLEELLNLIDQSEERMQDLSPEDLVEVEPVGKTPPAKPFPPKAVPRAKPNAPDAQPAARPAAKPTPEPTPKPAPKAAEAVKKTAQASPNQPGRILLLQGGGDDISLAVAALLEKVGIDLALLDEDSSSEMEGIIGQKNMAFTIMSVSSGPRGGLSGLTSVIGKPYPKHESAFKLGLLVGS